MLGDNPMQSEIACHVGLMGRMFCHVCKVKGKLEDSDDNDMEPEIKAKKVMLDQLQVLAYRRVQVESTSVKGKKLNQWQTWLSVSAIS